MYESMGILHNLPDLKLCPAGFHVYQWGVEMKMVPLHLNLELNVRVIPPQDQDLILILVKHVKLMVNMSLGPQVITHSAFEIN